MAPEWEIPTVLAPCGRRTMRSLRGSPARGRFGMSVRYRMGFVGLAFAFVTLIGSTSVTLGAIAPDPITTDARAELQRLARLAAETPGPWRQLPRSLASDHALGGQSLLDDALASPRAFASPTIGSLTGSEPGP